MTTLNELKSIIRRSEATLLYDAMGAAALGVMDTAFLPGMENICVAPLIAD